MSDSLAPSVDDLNVDAEEMLRDPKLADFLQVYNDKWNVNQAKSSSSQRGKGKQKAIANLTLEDRLEGASRVCSPPPQLITLLDPQIADAYKALEAVKLRSWT